MMSLMHLRKNLFQVVLLPPGVDWESLMSLAWLQSLSLFTWLASLCVFLSISPSCKDTSHVGSRTHPDPLWLRHNNYVFPSRLHSEVLMDVKFRRLLLNCSLVAQLAKNPPSMQETLVPCLGRRDPLEKRETPRSSILGLPWWLNW